MKSIKSLHFFKKPLYSALVFFGTVTALTIGYSNYISGLPAIVGSGSGLTAGEWNKMVMSLGELDTSLSNLTFSGGNVGIGVNPTQKLHISGNTNLFAKFESSADAPTGIMFKNTLGEFWVGKERTVASGFWAAWGLAGAGSIVTNNTSPLQLGTNATVNMTILNGGNVGIGTTSPNANAKLTLAGGGINLSSQQTNELALNEVGWIWHTSGPAAMYRGNNKFIIKGNTGGAFADNLVVDTSGYVGIGTPNPTQKLDVNGLIGIHSTTTTSLIGNIRMENDLFKIVTPSQKQWDFRDDGTIWFYNGSIWTKKNVN